MPNAQPASDATPTVPASALYKCEQCGNKFSADEVWNASGVVVCKGCYSKLASEAKGSVGVVHQPSTKPTPPPDRKPTTRNRLGTLLSNVTCPHCWQRSTPDQILWVSQHAELMGDTVLGSDAQSRFLPTRFTVEGDALDAQDSRILYALSRQIEQ